MIISCAAKSLLQRGGARLGRACRQIQWDYASGAREGKGRVMRLHPKGNMHRRLIYRFCEARQVPDSIIPANKLKEQIEKDIQQHFASFQTIRSSLIYHMAHHYTHKSQPELLEVLSLLATYPTFPLDTPTMLALYKLTCHNMHLKSVAAMNQLLAFVLVADSQASHSPIFHEFLRFYVQLPLEELKFKFQLDFASMSFTQAIRQFFGKLLHRGFLSRTPPYERNLNVVDARQLLLLLRRNGSVASTLMVKKLNYTIFLEIKEFYEQEMRENLYHPKKVTLLRMFTDRFLQVLSQEIEMTHHEAIHLRELYMKLYLTLPQPAETEAQKELEAFKYRKVIYLYKLAVKHIESLNHLKLEQINEKIDVVIDFVQCVDQNLQRLMLLKQEELMPLQLDFEELLLIILWVKKTGAAQMECLELFQLVKKGINCYTLWHYFQPLTEVLKYVSSSLPCEFLVENYENYSLLALGQLAALPDIFQHKESRPYCKNIGNILRKVLSTDFDLIGGQEIILFLRIYTSALPALAMEDVQAEAEGLRVFVMRYIADHHKQFSVGELEQIVVLLLALPEQYCVKFDDENGNYPLSVFQQISPYISKVSLLFGSEARELLATDRRLITE